MTHCCAIVTTHFYSTRIQTRIIPSFLPIIPVPLPPSSSSLIPNLWLWVHHRGVSDDRESLHSSRVLYVGDLSDQSPVRNVCVCACVCVTSLPLHSDRSHSTFTAVCVFCFERYLWPESCKKTQEKSTRATKKRKQTQNDNNWHTFNSSTVL